MPIRLDAWGHLGSLDLLVEWLAGAPSDSHINLIGKKGSCMFGYVFL